MREDEKDEMRDEKDMREREGERERERAIERGTGQARGGIVCGSYGSGCRLVVWAFGVEI